MDSKELMQQVLEEFNQEKTEEVVEDFKNKVYGLLESINENNHKIVDLQTINERLKFQLNNLKLQNPEIVNL